MKKSITSTFSNYIQVHLVSDTEEVKIGATVIAGFGARIVRINDYSVDFKPNAYQLVSYHGDKPGMVGLTGQLLGRQILILHQCHLAEIYKEAKR